MRTKTITTASPPVVTDNGVALSGVILNDNDNGTWHLALGTWQVTVANLSLGSHEFKASSGVAESTPRTIVVDQPFDFEDFEKYRIGWIPLESGELDHVTKTPLNPDRWYLLDVKTSNYPGPYTLETLMGKCMAGYGTVAQYFHLRKSRSHVEFSLWLQTPVGATIYFMHDQTTRRRCG